MVFDYLLDNFLLILTSDASEIREVYRWTTDETALDCTACGIERKH